jgi:hypothetical protein
MKTLSSTDDLTSIRSRIALISPTDSALWGSMSAPQMLLHLTDAFKYPLGERPVAPFKSLPIPRFLFKWLALSFPMKWPKGIKAPPEIDSRIGGTPPGRIRACFRAIAAPSDLWPAHHRRVDALGLPPHRPPPPPVRPLIPRKSQRHLTCEENQNAPKPTRSSR